MNGLELVEFSEFDEFYGSSLTSQRVNIGSSLTSLTGWSEVVASLAGSSSYLGSHDVCVYIYIYIYIYIYPNSLGKSHGAFRWEVPLESDNVLTT